MDSQEQAVYESIKIVSGVIGIILLYFIITIIRYQRRSLRLHKEKIQAEIDTLENERKRIASDLHDELGPLLSAVKLQINSLETISDDDQQVIDKSSMHLDSIIGKLREISNNLMPNTLMRKGLKRAISEVIEHTNHASGLQVKFVCEEELNLDQQKEINIYRMLQEILHNTIKHAEASYLIIKIMTEQNRLLIMTADNGKGFDYFGKLKENSGLGLRNLQSRVEVMGAEIFCQSELGKGTMYTVEIPI
ncbi:MAG: histidine kinase [Chitinophagaceae bacterium]